MRCSRPALEGERVRHRPRGRAPPRSRTVQRSERGAWRGSWTRNFAAVERASTTRTRMRELEPHAPARAAARDGHPERPPEPRQRGDWSPSCCIAHGRAARAIGSPCPRGDCGSGEQSASGAWRTRTSYELDRPASEGGTGSQSAHVVFGMLDDDAVSLVASGLDRDPQRLPTWSCSRRRRCPRLRPIARTDFSTWDSDPLRARGPCRSATAVGELEASRDGIDARLRRRVRGVDPPYRALVYYTLYGV